MGQGAVGIPGSWLCPNPVSALVAIWGANLWTEAFFSPSSQMNLSWEPGELWGWRRGSHVSDGLMQQAFLTRRLRDPGTDWSRSQLGSWCRHVGDFWPTFSTRDRRASIQGHATVQTRASSCGPVGEASTCDVAQPSPGCCSHSGGKHLTPSFKSTNRPCETRTAQTRATLQDRARSPAGHRDHKRPYAPSPMTSALTFQAGTRGPAATLYQMACLPEGRKGS